MAWSCWKCKVNIPEGTESISANGKLYHQDCFLPNTSKYALISNQTIKDEFMLRFEKPKHILSDVLVNGYLFCLEDYKLLFAPICNECEKPIIGKAIKSLNTSWHTECFKCYYCKARLEHTIGCSIYRKKIGCQKCCKTLLADTHQCGICKTMIPPNMHAFIKDMAVHPWHYLCNLCENELTQDVAKDSGKLYCKRCHDFNFGCICATCKKVIEGERSLFAMNKNYHHQHFCCAKCGVPLSNKSFYEQNDLFYCEDDFKEFYGKTCFICKTGVLNDSHEYDPKIHCSPHSMCYSCIRPIGEYDQLIIVNLTQSMAS
ncbi:LIM and senescent cell antigen-like-containing domain protein 1 [Thelohanellus kitauei]|uniref:LIM and senescent cell antigen-like-containing domain protein 1 n=1 Tax=Thelohanellus kitauei TaxID=669202 RepID=A0A0C2IAE7_THEKT|nr:LIM and senescent cell antigen-like-containing domain protein 1 [Thelohanellus kitauei]